MGPSPAVAAGTGAPWNIPVKTIAGQATTLSAWQGKVLLIVNTASQCGYTPQYEGLQQLHQRYGAKGLAVLGFPCNQFGGQEPGTSGEIARFCSREYGVTFPMFAKVEVNGTGTHPLYAWLKQAKPGDISWNFGKFLVDRKGKVVARYGSSAEPGALGKDIESLL
ncbi:MAG: glutathione peroxidase [Candidatus Sericytochromatia bacterium]|nr:glutathione peroxidase [Candidatus Sericytochromatia bacterium]